MLDSKLLSYKNRPKIAIVQSCYIPWKGFFDIVKAVDHFVVYDDVQYVRRHWHNRNRIVTPNGLLWLSIPVKTKGNYHETIDNIRVSEAWAEKHWKSIELNYKKAPHFADLAERFRTAYETADKLERLSDINMLFIRLISDILDLQTEFSWSTDHASEGVRTDRLLTLCQSLNARCYLSGPAAKVYFEGEKFDAAGIDYEWMDYSGYPEYPQMQGQEFEHGVTVLDLLFNAGVEGAHKAMKPFPEYKRS